LEFAADGMTETHVVETSAAAVRRSSSLPPSTYDFHFCCPIFFSIKMIIASFATFPTSLSNKDATFGGRLSGAICTLYGIFNMQSPV